MTASIQRETAMIYTFPAGGRAGVKARLAGYLGETTLEREAAALPAIAWDSWYHDAAIAEDDRVGQH